MHPATNELPDRAGKYTVALLVVREPIKPVPVPLLHPDPPVALDLGSAIHEAYRRARYDLEITYGEPPPPPELSAADAAWLDAHLRERGLRS
jgi:hypothetical protein